eukprot:scpid88514/ scgid23571/ 
MAKQRSSSVTLLAVASALTLALTMMMFPIHGEGSFFAGTNATYATFVGTGTANGSYPTIGTGGPAHHDPNVRILKDVRIFNNITEIFSDDSTFHRVFLPDCKKQGGQFIDLFRIFRGHTDVHRERHGNCMQISRCTEFERDVATFPRFHFEMVPFDSTWHYEITCSCINITYPFSYLAKAGDHWELKIKSVVVGQRCNKDSSCRIYEC